MILRRLTDAFRRQDWFAVAVETMIVVLGVFLGLQVNNWNEARGERAQEAIYLAGLAEDIRSDIADIDEINRVSALTMSAMGYLLEEATGRKLPTGFASARGMIAVEETPPYLPDDPNSIGVAMFIFTPLDGNRLAYDTMINTGGIGVMRDTRLVRAVQTYYANVDKLIHFEVSLEENRAHFVDAQQEAGLSPVDLMPAAEIVDAFAASPSLMAGAKNYWLYTNRHLKLMNDLRAEAEALLLEIEGRTP